MVLILKNQTVIIRRRRKRRAANNKIKATVLIINSGVISGIFCINKLYLSARSVLKSYPREKFLPEFNTLSVGKSPPLPLYKRKWGTLI